MRFWVVLLMLVTSVSTTEFFPKDHLVRFLHKNTFQNRITANNTASIVTPPNSEACFDVLSRYYSLHRIANIAKNSHRFTQTLLRAFQKSLYLVQ